MAAADKDIAASALNFPSSSKNKTPTGDVGVSSYIGRGSDFESNGKHYVSAIFLKCGKSILTRGR